MFEWYVYGLLTAILAAAAAIAIKRTLFKEHAMEFAATFAFVAAIITAPFLFFIDYSTIPLHGLALIVVSALLAAIAYLFVTKAVRHMPVSVSNPLLALGPVFSAVLAFILLGEKLSLTSVLGLMLVIGGVYILQHKHGVSVKKTFKLMMKQRHVKFIFAALILYAIAGVVGRYLLAEQPIGLGIPVMHVLALEQIIIALFFFFLLWLFYDGTTGIKHACKTTLLPIILIAMLTVIYRYTGGVAISMAAGKLGLVEALKRTSVLLVIFIGGSLFHEKDLPQRIFATFIIIGGVLLIII